MIGFVVKFTILNINFGLCYSRLCASGRCCDGFKLDKMSNSCVACRDGLIGEECNKLCPYPTYGRNCHFKCGCTKEFCNVSIGCLQATTVPLQKTTFNRSSRLITMLTTSEVAHNKTNDFTESTCPQKVSDPILSQTELILLQTSVAVLFGIFLLLLLVHFLVYFCRKCSGEMNMFQDLSEGTN